MLYVSLGAWCQVAHQLKSHAGDQFVPSAWDWIVGPLNSVSKMLDTDGDNFCEGMSLSKPSNSLTCEGYGILYHHEFKRGDKGEAFSSKEGIVNVRSKLTHKHKSMSSRLRSTDECVTFVRFGGHAKPLVAWPYANDSSPVSANEINEIAYSIERAFPNIAFRILFVTCPTAHVFTIDHSQLDPRVWTVEMKQRPGSKWEGSDDDWAEVISRVPETFARLTNDSPRQEFPFTDIDERVAKC